MNNFSEKQIAVLRKDFSRFEYLSAENQLELKILLALLPGEALDQLAGANIPHISPSAGRNAQEVA